MSKGLFPPGRSARASGTTRTPRAFPTSSSSSSLPAPRSRLGSAPQTAAGGSSIVTETHDRDGGLTRYRDQRVSLSLHQVRDGQEQGGNEEERYQEQQRPPSISSAADGGEHAESTSLVPHSNASAAALSAPAASEFADVSALPACLLPAPTPTFVPEPAALGEQEDVVLSDIWRACGYNTLADLLPDNLVRAFDPSMSGSAEAWERYQAIEKMKKDRMTKYGFGLSPVITVEQVNAMAKTHLKAFRRDMDNIVQMQMALHTAIKRKPPTVTLASEAPKRQREEEKN